MTRELFTAFLEAFDEPELKTEEDVRERAAFYLDNCGRVYDVARAGGRLRKKVELSRRVLLEP